MEYLKPYIARRQREKMIRGLVDDEFLANLGELEACLRVLKHAFPGTADQKAHSLMVVDEIMHRVIQDRYDLYFEQDKEIVWAIDKKRLLWSFYEALSRKPEDVTLSSEHIEIELWIDRVVRRGKSYLEEAELLYEPGENPNEQIYYELDAAEKKGRAEGLNGGGYTGRSIVSGLFLPVWTGGGATMTEFSTMSGRNPVHVHVRVDVVAGMCGTARRSKLPQS